MTRSSPCRRPLSAVVGALALVSVLAACSTEVEVRTTATDDLTPTAAGDPLAPDATTNPPVDGGTTGSDGPPADGAEAEASDRNGDGPLHTPARAEAVAVVGVAFDESVAMRAAARPGAQIVAELSARFDQASGTGQGRSGAGTNWWQIRVGQQTGWVDSSFMARLGATTDVTAEVVADLGATPATPTMRALGRLVADARLGDDAQARIVLSGAPTVGDVGEVVYDIVGRADASVAGERLVVFATLGDGFVLRSVESTILCARGVTADGRCT